MEPGILATSFTTLLVQGFFDPAILFFVFGLLTVLVKADVEIPPDIAKFFSLLLMFSIGWRGAMDVTKALGQKPEIAYAVLAVAVVCVGLGVSTAWASGNILKRVCKLSTADAWATAGHFAAVGSATLFVAVSIAESAQLTAPDMLVYGGWMFALYPFMDSPALITAIFLGRMALARENAASGPARGPSNLQIFRMSALGMAVWILVGSLVIGLFAAKYADTRAVASVSKLADLFRGILCLFLLEIGMVAGRQLHVLKDMKAVLLRSALFAVIAPQVLGVLAVLIIFGLNRWLLPGSLGWGDALVFSGIVGSASFITAPVAMRIGIPEANPSVYLPLAITITFPFNVLVGLPANKLLAMYLWGVL